VPTMSTRNQRAAVRLGDHIATWRKLLNLTADQVAQRADITRGTLRRLENGETVGLDVLLSVTRALGVIDQLVDSVDPWESDIGRARAGAVLPKRVRNHD
jgi:transcriptional regulator with XRE-family HTH domain